MSARPYDALVASMRAHGDRVRAERGLPPLRRHDDGPRYELVHLDGGGWRLTIPGLKLVSEANRASHEHWRVRQNRVKEQRDLVALALVVTRAPRLTGRLDCTITRCGGRGLDSDNLAGSGKAVRDAIAEHLGVSDGPRGPVRWRVDQRPGEDFAAIVTLRPRVDHAPSCAADIDPDRPCSCRRTP